MVCWLIFEGCVVLVCLSRLALWFFYWSIILGVGTNIGWLSKGKSRVDSRLDNPFDCWMLALFVDETVAFNNRFSSTTARYDASNSATSLVDNWSAVQERNLSLFGVSSDAGVLLLLSACSSGVGLTSSHDNGMSKSSNDGVRFAAGAIGSSPLINLKIIIIRIGKQKTKKKKKQP